MTDIKAVSDGLLTPPEGWSPQDPTVKRAPSGQTEVYLPDQRVWQAQEQIVRKYPLFLDLHTDFATVLHQPPWTGQLPDGTTGTTLNEVLQFVLVSDYPATRKIQREHGVRHGSVATVWQRAFDVAEYTYQKGGHFAGQGKDDPVLGIFSALAHKHYTEIMDLASIMN